MPDVDIGAAFGMAPKDAVSYFRAKGLAVSDRWQEIWADAHTRAFTVAKAMNMDVLTTLRGEVDKALSDGLTEAQFAENLIPRLKALGWWGQQTWVDNQGQTRRVQLGSPYRLRTIYRTNLQTAYMAGRYRKQLATTRRRPYWMYVAVMDSHTRPSHAALNGRVFRYDDPIWQYLYPPNGWNCRCRVRTLTARQVEQMGLTVENGEDYIETFNTDAGMDERTGELYRVPHMRANLPGGVTMSPDVGWAYNPGASTYGTDMAVAQKLGAADSVELRSQVIQTLNNSALRQQAFGRWAESVLAKRRAGHSVQAVGFMSEAISLAIADRLGHEPSRLLAIGEKNLLHADSEKHRRDDVVLSLDEYRQIPAMLNAPEAVLWERAENTLLLVFPAEDGRKIKLVIRPHYNLKRQKQPLDVLINAFKVSARSLINSGTYEVIQGEVIVGEVR